MDICVKHFILFFFALNCDFSALEVCDIIRREKMSIKAGKTFSHIFLSNIWQWNKFIGILTLLLMGCFLPLYLFNGGGGIMPTLFLFVKTKEKVYFVFYRGG